MINAAQDSLRLNKDYADTQTNFDLMRAVIEREKLDPSNISHLNAAWSRVKVITRNDAPDQTPATVRPRQTTVLPVPVAPAPEPPIEEAQAALDEAAEELISNYGGTGGFKTFFNTYDSLIRYSPPVYPGAPPRFFPAQTPSSQPSVLSSKAPRELLPPGRFAL